LDQTVSDFFGAEKVIISSDFSYLSAVIGTGGALVTLCASLSESLRVWCGVRSVEDADDDLFITPFGHLPWAELRVRGSGQ